MAEQTVIQFNVNDVVAQNRNETPAIEEQQSTQINNVIQSEVQEQKTIEDIALIQSFWGIDQDRIIACNQALKKLSQMTVKSKDWIFIEAQKNKSDAAFGWVKHLGIKYIFKKIPKESEGIFLKMPLWNIGVANTECKRLCFIDSDIYFEKNDWLDEVDEILGNRYDVIQLHAYAKQEGKDDVVESIGHSIMKHKLETGEDLGFKFGHGGYTLGMTRSAYHMINGFDAVPRLSDQQFWSKIIGYSKNSFLLLPYKQNEDDSGYPLIIGSTSVNAIHIFHNDNANKYFLSNYFSCKHGMMLDDNIKYETHDQLPIWNDDVFSKVIKACFLDLQQGIASQSTYFRNLKKYIGSIDNDKYKLIIVTLWYPDYTHNDSILVIKFKDMLEKMCNTQFQFICFSNEDIYNIDTIPYEEYAKNKRKTKKECVKEIFSRKIKYPHKSSILYLDIDEVFEDQFELVKCIDINPVNINKYGIEHNGVYCYIP